jgi:hypothetical protein
MSIGMSVQFPTRFESLLSVHIRERPPHFLVLTP